MRTLSSKEMGSVSGGEDVIVVTAKRPKTMDWWEKQQILDALSQDFGYSPGLGGAGASFEDKDVDETKEQDEQMTEEEALDEASDGLAKLASTLEAIAEQAKREGVEFIEVAKDVFVHVDDLSDLGKLSVMFDAAEVAGHLMNDDPVGAVDAMFNVIVSSLVASGVTFATANPAAGLVAGIGTSLVLDEIGNLTGTITLVGDGLDAASTWAFNVEDSQGVSLRDMYENPREAQYELFGVPHFEFPEIQER